MKDTVTLLSGLKCSWGTEVPSNLAKSCFSVTEVDIIITVIISCHLELQAQFRLGSVLVSHWRVESFSHWLQCLSVQFCGLLSLTGINHWPLVMQCLMSCTWNFYANPWQQVKNNRRTTLQCLYKQGSQAYFLPHRYAFTCFELQVPLFRLLSSW